MIEETITPIAQHSLVDFFVGMNNPSYRSDDFAGNIIRFRISKGLEDEQGDRAAALEVK